MPIAYDSEATYSKDRDIKSLGATNYIKHRETDHYLASFWCPEWQWVGHPSEAPWERLQGQTLLSHNRSYDYRVALHTAPPLELENWHCTADLAAYCQAPRALKDAARELLGIQISKEVRDKLKGKRWEDLTPEQQKETKDYALKDAEICWRLWDKWGHTWPEHERRLSMHTTELTTRGIGLDQALLEDGILTLRIELEKCERLIPWADGETPVTSPKALALECRKLGIEPPVSTDAKSEEFDLWAAKYAAQVPLVEAVQTWRSVNRTLKVLEAMKVRAVADCLPVELKYHGASHTGRWCLTGSHEVLTPTGWIPLTHWQPSEPIVSYDPATSGLNFCKAQKNIFTKGGSLLSVKSPTIQFKVTPEHSIPFISKRGIVALPADQAKLHGRRIPISGTWQGPEKLKLLPEEIQLMVATQADGHHSHSEKFKGWKFGFRKPRKVERLRAILDKLGVAYICTNYPGDRVSFTITDKHAPWYMTKDFSIGILLGLSQENLACFLDELVHWDGTHPKNSKGFYYYTTNKNNAECVVTVAHLCGRAASIKAANREPEKWSTCYKVFVRSNDSTNILPEHWSVEWTEKPVYCPTTDTGMFLCRNSEGQVFVTGNSGSGGCNLQNLPRHSVCGVDCRGMLVPRDGNKLIVADYSQIEARVLLWLVSDTGMLDLLRSGLDLYEAHARRTMGYTDPRPLKEVDPEKRQFAKCRVLGLGYGLGASKFIRVVQQWTGMDIDAATAERQVKAFRQANPKITALWRKLDRAARQDREFHCCLPSGRVIRYFDCQLYEGDLTGRVERGDHRTKLWGGKLTENLVQATARELLADAILRLEDAGLPVVLHVHDEIVVEAPEEALPDVKRIMEAVPEWAEGLPVAVDAHVCERYEK